MTLPATAPAVGGDGAACAVRPLPAPKRFEKMPGSAYLAGRTRTIVARMGSAELP